MKAIILLMVLFFSSLQAVDYTIQTIFGATMHEKEKNPETSLNGELMLYLLDEDDIKADAAFKAGDEGNYFNRARVKLIGDWWDLAIGRQQIGWGNGYNFNPTDIFNAKPLGAAFDPSYTKKGRDSIILTTYFKELFSFEMIYGFKSKTESDLDEFIVSERTNWDLGGKLKTNLLDYDVALSFSYTDLRIRNITPIMMEEKLEPRKLAGVSIAGSLPVIDFGIWLEGIYNIETEEYELVTGTEYVFWENYTLNIEYYRNSQGATVKKDYDLNRLFFGEMLAQDYLIPSLCYVASEKLELAGFSFLNLNDQSSINAVVIDYYFNDYVDFILTPFYLSGGDRSEFGFQIKESGNYGIDFKIRLFI